MAQAGVAEQLCALREHDLSLLCCPSDPAGDCDWCPTSVEEPALLTSSWNLQNSQQEALSLLLGRGATGLEIGL